MRGMEPDGPGEPPTNRFYECPACHDPGIETGPDGVAACKRCGFEHDFKPKHSSTDKAAQ